MRKRHQKKILKKLQKKAVIKQQTSVDLENKSTISEEELAEIKQLQQAVTKLEKEVKEITHQYLLVEQQKRAYQAEVESLNRKENELISVPTSEVSEGNRDVLARLNKMQVNYEGMLAREKRYLKEIEKLKLTIKEQNNKLYKTFSYRLGYLLIHSTKSWKNFFRLPSDLINLYLENRQRKASKNTNSKNIKLLSKKRVVGHTPAIYKSLQTTDSKESHITKIATIMDAFTSLCFAPEAETMQLTPDNFEQEILQFKPDFVFIESAWQGKDGLWKLKISHQEKELLQLIQFCREQNIKTLFWNKEDPVHFGTFIEVAKLVDVVFTTDIDCIERYKNIVQHDQVYLLPFAAQPKTHNPIELYDRIDKFNFAGSYYLKYPVRQRDFATLSEVAIKSKGIDIYDRNFDNDHPHYQFPERYQSYILGSLAPEEIDKAYKGYQFGINMNTIKQSQTMFARRVFEMLASNTLVMSNYSRGVRLLFGDLVICSDQSTELERQLDNVISDEVSFKKFKLQGLRKVLSEHTYTHRLRYLLEKLKIKTQDFIEEKDKRVVVISQCDTEKDIERTIKSFKQQAINNKVLYIVTTATIIKEIKDVHYLDSWGGLKTIIDNIQFDYITVFNELDIYGPHYLEDMLLSRHYLKHHDLVAITKGSYYRFLNSNILEEGKEYHFVDSYYPVRTLIPSQLFSTINKNYSLQDLLRNKKIESKAFSIDSFSYLKEGYLADEESIRQICDDDITDSGVSLMNHLLPVAESITYERFEAPKSGIIELDDSEIKRTLRKEITFNRDNKEVSLISRLPAQQHRLIAVTKAHPIKGYNRITINTEIEARGDVLFVFEFLDSSYHQVSHFTLAPNPLISMDIPEGAIYGKANIRVKGEADVKILGNFSIGLENTFDFIQDDSLETEGVIVFDKDEIDAQLVRPQSKQIQINNNADGCEIRSTLAEDKHAYIYFREIFNRSDINLLLNSVFETKATVEGIDLRSVFLFLDENKEKIAHSIIKVDNFSHAMAIPENCQFVRVGFKVTGSGNVLLHTLKIGELKEKVNCLIGKSDTLVLAKQYPAYDDLYKYGFLHSRLRAYKKAGTIVDMFRFKKNADMNFREFEGIDIFQGDSDQLRKALSSGQFNQVFIHLIDTAMWDIVKEFKDKLTIYIWIHGAEIQTWQRRAFEFDLMTTDQIERQKRLSASRVKFWQNLLDHEAGENVHFIFVSQYLREESEEGLKRIFPDERTFIIHNYIDEEIFPYEPKPVEQRYNLLTIRPFAGKKYGNDITVNAILELAKTPQFSQFNIEICGDGPLFDETVEPLKQFENVIINRGFLSHDEMAEKYQQYGVFINPTRWDSQGVSRDEARIAGLVSISSNITAIPEFVSPNDGILVDVEDYKELADKILQLAENPDYFSRISINGRLRVLEQCNQKQTIYKELRLIAKG